MRILRITSKRNGFRRAGIAHPAHAVDHPADRFDEEQIAALLAEPMLVVEQVEIPDPDDKTKSEEKTGKKPAARETKATAREGGDGSS